MTHGGEVKIIDSKIFPVAPISLAEWIAHTPHLLMDQHLQVGTSMLDAIPKQEIVVRPV